MERRHAIKLLGTASAGLPIIGMAKAIKLNSQADTSALDIRVFSKHLQFLNYKEMAEVAKEIGFDGIDLTVRKGGHVEPERVVEELPLATEAMKSVGLSPSFITTNVLNAEDPIDREVLVTASKLQYDTYRMGWLKYSDSQSMTKSLTEFKKLFRSLALLNNELGFSGSYQNHSGNYMGSAFWDLKEVLADIPPSEIGSQYDIMHATVDGGTNWELGLRLLKNNINSFAVKDFSWNKINGKWYLVKTPLGEGMVDIRRFLTLKHKYNLNLPITMHFEYELGGAEHGARNVGIKQDELIHYMRKDLLYLRKKWDEVIRK